MALNMGSLAESDLNSGFGINVDWDWDKTEIPKGHTMPFLQALCTATEGIPIRVAFPGWLLSLTKSGRKAIRGHNEMEVSHLSVLHQWT